MKRPHSCHNRNTSSKKHNNILLITLAFIFISSPAFTKHNNKPDNETNIVPVKLPYYELGQSLPTGCDIGDCKNGKGRYIYSDGNIFEGQWVKGKRQGQGVYIYKDGRIYSGSWLDDKRHGPGVHIEVTGNKEEQFYYYGEKINVGCNSGDCQNGSGKFTFENGETYEGQWVNGKRHGKGTYTAHNGIKYEGPWVNDKKHGAGVYLHPDNEKEYCLHNYGKLILKSSKEKKVRRYQEFLFWKNAKTIDTIDSYNNYLNKYPEGRFASIAHLEKAALIRKEKKALLAAEAAKKQTQQAPDDSLISGMQLNVNSAPSAPSSSEIPSKATFKAIESHADPSRNITTSKSMVTDLGGILPPSVAALRAPFKQSNKKSAKKNSLIKSRKRFSNYYSKPQETTSVPAEKTNPQKDLNRQLKDSPLVTQPMDKEAPLLALKALDHTNKNNRRLPRMLGEGFGYQQIPSAERCYYKVKTGGKRQSFSTAHIDYVVLNYRATKLHRELFTLNYSNKQIVNDCVMRDNGKVFHPVFHLRTVKDSQGNLMGLEEIAFRPFRGKAQVIRKVINPEFMKRSGEAVKNINFTLPVPKDAYAPLMFDFGFRATNFKVGDETVVPMLSPEGMLLKAKIKVDSIVELTTPYKTFFCYKVVQTPTTAMSHQSSFIYLSPFTNNRSLPESIFYYSVDEPHRLVGYYGYKNFGPMNSKRRQNTKDFIDIRLNNIMELSNDNSPNHQFLLERMATHQLFDTQKADATLSSGLSPQDTARLENSDTGKDREMTSIPPELPLL